MKSKEAEPIYRMIEELKSLELRASAVSDWARYDLKVNQIQFKNTLMFQSRSFVLPLKNTSSASMSCSWQIPAPEIGVSLKLDRRCRLTCTGDAFHDRAGEMCHCTRRDIFDDHLFQSDGRRRVPHSSLW